MTIYTPDTLPKNVANPQFGPSINQISFRMGSLSDLREMHQRLVAEGGAEYDAMAAPPLLRKLLVDPCSGRAYDPTTAGPPAATTPRSAAPAGRPSRKAKPLVQ